jgi:glutaminyl-tRNA synthetase
MEDPPKKYFRMAVGKEVRLKYAYYVTCQKVIKDEDGKIIELICEYDPESRGGGTPDERKVKGTIQWVDSTTAINPEIRLYDRLFKVPNPDEVEEGKDFLSNLNADSLTSLSDALVEKSIEELQAGEPFQLERIGYFTLDTKARKMGKLVLNRSVAMRDSWAKKHSK